tara:strand:- start:355 stop:1068 length:714 start_codon:yes stop_codon:yes gene_type:complete
MRKIFIDGGANNGCSTNKFIKRFPNADDYEIYMFEANPKSCTEHIEKVIDKYPDRNITYIPKAIWINEDGVEIFNDKKCGGSNNIFKANKTGETYKVESVHLSEWIKSNFSKDDYIVLKLDVEGAEYGIVEDLYKNDILSYINEAHGELHGIKKNFNINDDLKLLESFKKYNLEFFTWNGENMEKPIKTTGDTGYTVNHIEKDYTKWEKRNFPMKPDWDMLEYYKNNYEEWYSENME